MIRIFSGSVKRDQTEAEAHRLAVTAIEECCEYAGKKGIHLALENHGGLTATAAGMLKLVRDVKSPWFGVNLDSGNFHGEDVYGELAQIAPYAVNVQIKVVVSAAGQKEGSRRISSGWRRSCATGDTAATSCWSTRRPTKTRESHARSTWIRFARRFA